MDAEWLQEREPLGGLPAAQLRVTPLAAGFVIGASGASVRSSRRRRARAQSWTEKPPTTRAVRKRRRIETTGNDFPVFHETTIRRPKKKQNVPTNPTRVFRARRPGGCLARR